MAVVLRRMLAGMGARARTLTDWLLGAARHWRIDHFGTTFAVQLLETAAVAWRTIATVTGLVALVLATAQGSVAWQWACMVYVDAALGIAFVLATATLLGAAALATGIVRPAR